MTEDRGAKSEGRGAKGESGQRSVSGDLRSSITDPSSRLAPRPSTLWHHRYATFLAFCTLLLIAAGGMVTSTGSGLSVPDWPTTYGWSMFTFPMSKWVGGIRYEHTHRLIASTVGFLTIVLAFWTWRVEPRRWVRGLAFGALGVVILQGLLGGLTVLFLLPPAVSTAHAGLAQIFFCLTVTIAVVTSTPWRLAESPVDDTALRRLATGTTAAIYVQILLGATMRHTNSGLAIPDFPLAFGHLLPPVWNAHIAIHFAHRAVAGVVTLLILAIAGHVWAHHRCRLALIRISRVLLGLVLVQVALGAFVVLSGKQPIINTAHVVNGALVLAASLVLTLRSWRIAFPHRAVRAAPRTGASPVGSQAPLTELHGARP
jgi:cytochrome c oxidase assembly protein subunit 15